MRIRKNAAVLVLVLALLFLAYFWPFKIYLDDVRPYLPRALDRYVQDVLNRLPPDKNLNVLLPLPEVKYDADFYLDPVVKRGEFNATRWILNNTAPDDKFVADIFGAELIMGMTCRVSTEGGDWANAPDPVSMMSHTNDIFKTDNASYAHDLAKLEGADYVFLPYRDLYTGWYVEQDAVNYSKFLDRDYFEAVYADGDLTIYRVL